MSSIVLQPAVNKLVLSNKVGPKGDTGEGVASGGTSGQVLIKGAGGDFDTAWDDANNHTHVAADITDDIDADTVDGIEGADIAQKDYVQSRVAGLVTNGTALLSDNTNFAGWTFDGAESVVGGGSFKVTGLNNVKYSDEFIPVNPYAYYKLRAWMKGASGVGRSYGGVALYDIDYLQILPGMWAYLAGSTTTLAADLDNGDTQVVLTDIGGWVDSATSTQRGFLLWGYTNSFGYIYPNETYSRYAGAAPQWTQTTGFDVPTKTITLDTPWTGASRPAGTAISQAYSGNTFKYSLWSNILQSTTWAEYESYIGDAVGGSAALSYNRRFAPGTAFMKMLFLGNYTSSDTLYINGVEAFEHPNIVKSPDGSFWLTGVDNAGAFTAVAPTN